MNQMEIYKRKTGSLIQQLYLDHVNGPDKWLSGMSSCLSTQRHITYLCNFGTSFSA
jgi:hypothetical protein